MKIHPAGAKLFHAGQTGMTKLTVTFCYSANAPTTQRRWQTVRLHTLWPSGSSSVKNSAAKSLACKLVSHLSAAKFFLKAKV